MDAGGFLLSSWAVTIPFADMKEIPISTPSRKKLW